MCARRCKLFLVLALFLLGAGSATAPAAAQESKPVYALIGVIEQTRGAAYENRLRTPDNALYALAGMNATIEREIVRLRDLRPQVQVKVWGTLYQAAAGDLPRIVVSEIASSSDPPRGGEQAMAEVAVPALNVRAGPSTASARVGQIQQGQRFPIVGRSAGARPWWYLCCPAPDGREGWVSGDLVIVTGDVASVPLVSVADPAAQAPPLDHWRVSYFADETLRSAPDAWGMAQEIAFDWGAGAPAPGLPADFFAARFERTIDFDGRLYQFSARGDDGIRVWIDETLVIDQWRGATAETYTHARYLSGRHAVRVEFLELAGNAWLRFWYQPLEAPRGQWLALYYDTIPLSGEPALARIEPAGQIQLQYNWSLGSPQAGVIPNDNWSARWEGLFYFEPGDYFFEAKVDDGINLYLAGHHVIQGWSDDAKRVGNHFLRVGAGWHKVVVEYYERGGLAYIELDWFRRQGTGPSPF